MIGDNRKAAAELRRILWRQRVLTRAGGPEWLALQIQQHRKREKDLGPQLFCPLLIQE